MRAKILTCMTSAARASVIVPAHNEGRVLRGTLTALLAGVPEGALDVVVVCNGCTDDTAAVAAELPGVRVLEIPEPSKAKAVAAGNAASSVFPRIHLDADVRLSSHDAMRLLVVLEHEGVHAVAPMRVLPMSQSSWPVRAFYRVWQELPHVRDGLFGRGVVALSETGQARVDALPGMMSDDLAVSEAFAPTERRIVPDASVIVQPPRTVADLLRRRVRVATGNAQYDGSGMSRQSTSLSLLLRMGLRDPRLAMRIPIFVGIGLRARQAARHAVRAGDYTTWLRDESSRAA